jgi:hypothetical protein
MLRLFTIFALLSLLISCQKENGTNPVPPPTTNDSILVNKIIGLDTSQTAPFDTIYKLYINYDNFKRAKNLFVILYNNTGFIVDTITNRKFSYNSTDTLPNIVTTISHDINESFDTSYYYYATSSANIIYDSTIYNDITSPSIQTTVSKYAYTANTISETSLSYTNHVLQSTDFYRYYITKQNNNITTQIDTSDNEARTSTMLYDNNPNPLQKIFDPVPYFGVYNDDLLYFGSRNLIEFKTIAKDLTNNNVQVYQHFKYSYIYNQWNRPVSAKIENLNNNSISLNKINYYYTN